MSSNEFLTDAASRHSVLLQRFSAGLEKEASASVSKAIADLLGRLVLDYEEGLGTGRLGSLRTGLVLDYNQELKALEDDLIAQLLELAGDEAEFTVDMLDEAVNVKPSPVLQRDLFGAVRSSTIDVVPGQKITIPKMLRQFTTKKTSQINTLLRDGFTAGATQGELIKEIRSVTKLQRQQAASLVRTGTNAVSSAARYEAMLANSNLFDGYEWVATLDNRTSNVCMARDGKIYPFKDSSPKPPAHFSCRSTIVPKVKKKFDLLSDVQGDRPSVGPDGAKTVSGQSTYGGWLRKQPASFQNEALGPARAKLFRQGGLNIEKFVNFDGRTYTLDELRGLNPLAFERANL